MRVPYEVRGAQEVACNRCPMAPLQQADVVTGGKAEQDAEGRYREIGERGENEDHEGMEEWGFVKINN
jgi:hypothetical protein